MATTQAPGVPNIDMDTFYHILSHLTPDPTPRTGNLKEPDDSKSARKALSRLARVHSSFTQPVLTIMWRSLPSETPLEHLLCVVGIAHRLRREYWQDGPPVEMCGTPATHASGWKRFQEYAALVHEIIVYPFVRYRGVPFGMPAKPLEDTFWCQVSAAFASGKPVLPHLTRAAVRTMDFDNIPIDMGLLLLLNPSGHGIRELEVSIPRVEEGDVRRLKSALGAGAFSSIQTLDVLVPHLDPEDVKLLPCSHPHLRHLELHRSGAFIELDYLRPLATLPHLQSLTFSLQHSWQPPEQRMAFKELRSLKMSCHAFGGVGVFLAHVDAPRLQSFSVSEWHTDSNTMSTELPGHLLTLLAKCPSLTGFEWDSTQEWMPRVGYLGNQEAGAPLASLVAPLLSHRALRSFEVGFYGPIVSYTPADFRAFAEGWPDLETFRLYHESDEDEAWARVHQRADVESIVSFARHCPRLHSLGVLRVVQSESDPSPVNSESVHLLPDTPHCLRELSVSYVTHCSKEDSEEVRPRGREAEVVAQFRGLMERIFPEAKLELR